MRSIFRLPDDFLFDEAKESLGMWLYNYSSAIYDNDAIPVAMKMAEEFLRQENPHLEISCGL